MPSPKKLRLDQLLVQLELAPTRTKAQAMILANEVLIGETPITKAGHLVPFDSQIRLRNPGPKYVSRGGEKLAGALAEWKIDPTGMHCLDIGASTGGFTDCLLQNSAKDVIAIDVGKGQLDPKIRNDERVRWYESFHVKNLNEEVIPTKVDLAAVDVSFISLRKTLPYVLPFIKDGGILLALIKPQFEGTRKDVQGSGVVKNETRRQEIITELRDFAAQNWPLTNLALADSKLKGPKGNQETFLFGRKT